MLLKDKVALVTGANRGIGKAIAERFVQSGAIVYATARREGSLDELVKNLNDSNCGKLKPVYFDVQDKTAIKECILNIRREQKHLDVLVNNAGIMQDAALGRVSDEMLEQTFQTNVYAPIHFVQMAVKIMQRQGSGSIINMASIVGLRGNAGQTAYAASKGAVVLLTRTWAREFATDGLRVNAIAPGNIDTELFHAIGEEKEAAITEAIGLGRLGKPEEVADTALFLASDMSSYVTGEIIGVNGGWFL